MAWLVAKNLTGDGKPVEQHIHSDNWHCGDEALKSHLRFRLLDGDGNIYFEGVASVGEEFQPLDDFGREYGCTQIDYLEEANWKEL